MNDMRYWGCVGKECPKKETCARYLERETEDRPHTFRTPPYNLYNNGIEQEFRCGYKVLPKKEL